MKRNISVSSQISKMLILIRITLTALFAVIIAAGTFIAIPLPSSSQSTHFNGPESGVLGFNYPGFMTGILFGLGLIISFSQSQP